MLLVNLYTHSDTFNRHVPIVLVLEITNINFLTELSMPESVWSQFKALPQQHSFLGAGANQKWSKHGFQGYIDCYGLERQETPISVKF